MSGWIKAHRKLMDNPIVCKDSDHLAIWMYLLLNATHKEHQAVFGGEKIILKPGQLITGRKSISDKLRVTESKVQRVLKCFESEHQIEQQTGNKNRLVTIVSWLEYQDSEQQIEQQVNNKRTTDEQQMNTNKNVKNANNAKNVRSKKTYTPEFLEFWSVYPRPLEKSDAFKTWEKVIKNGESPSILIQCATNYAQYCETKKTAPEYIKHPKSFLNEERYKDFLVVVLPQKPKTTMDILKEKLKEAQEQEAKRNGEGGNHSTNLSVFG